MAKVLVIDDERLIQWSIQQTLSAAGHEVMVCDTGAEGLALFRQLRPEVVFLDVRLPDANGATVLKSIQADAGPGTVVIMMTAFEDDCTEEDAKRLGACTYLRKPFDFDQLNVLVSSALKRVTAPYSPAEDPRRRPSAHLPRARSRG